MRDDDLEPVVLESTSHGKRNRFEARFVVIIALALIILGGGYVAFFGSPTAYRAQMDSRNGKPIPELAPRSAPAAPAPR